MGDKRVKRRFWPTHIYDYNYKVSEGYYKPQYNYMFKSDFERSRYSPPKHATYAERFASSPWYGTAKGLPYGHQYPPTSNDPGENHYRESPLLQDRPLDVRASRQRRRFDEEDQLLGIRQRQQRTISLEDERRNRLPPSHRDVGQKLRQLDAELVRLAPRRTEASHYDSPSSSSGRPPVGPRARKFSFTEEADLQPRPRQRVTSVGESNSPSAFLRTSRRSSIDDDEDLLAGYANRAPQMREIRRIQQSRDITDGVYKLVEKMRLGRLDKEDGYMDREEKGIRPSRLDPRFMDDKNLKSSFTYYTKKRV